jgi:hypothetical protein
LNPRKRQKHPTTQGLGRAFRRVVTHLEMDFRRNTRMATGWIVIGWIFLHVLSFAWACGTRVAAGSRLETLAQLGFFVALAAIGASAFLGRLVDASWIWSAVTFMAMVITAIVDFRHVGEPVHASVHS